MHIFQDPGLGGIVLHDAGNTPCREAHGVTSAILLVHEALLGIGDKEGRIDIGAGLKVVCERTFRLGRDKHDTELATLPADTEFFLVEIDVVPVKGYEL